MAARTPTLKEITMLEQTTAAIVFDTETTGFTNPEVIELSWVALTDRTFEKEDYIHCDRFRPEGPIELGAVATHHILPSDLRYCPPSAEAKLPASPYLIGHNVDFDWDVMGKPQAKRICTLALSRYVWPHLDSHKLSAMFYHIHGCNELTRDVVRNAHSALHDVSMTYQLLKCIIEKVGGVKDLAALHALSEKARIPTIMTFGKYKGSPIRDVDKGWVAWYRKQPDTDPYLLIAFTQAGK
jgi:exodeoxyribonuclease X